MTSLLARLDAEDRMRIGIHLPTNESGPLSYREMAALAEDAGFDTLWLSDHTVLVRDAVSRYPFSDDGRLFQAPDVDWYDWLVTLAFLAASTTTIRLGVSVTILPLRHPLALAKQVATLDRLSGGRIVLGVGTGWLAEEFAALDVPFAGRGARTDGAIDLLRAAWTGSPAAGDYGPFQLPSGVEVRPTPTQARLPILVGGAGDRVVRRVVARADGWLGTSAGGRMAPTELRSMVGELARECVRVGRDPSDLDVAVRLAAPARQVRTSEYRDWLVELADAGATSMSFDVAWHDAARVRETLSALRHVSAGVIA
jgi:probable F420-dependent oxidoreductase